MSGFGSTEELQRDLLGGANQLAASAQRLYRWRAVAKWAAFTLAGVFLLMVADMVSRREELGLRYLSLFCLLGASGYAAYRLLWPALRFRPSAIDVARWVEETRPHSQKHLADALELSQIPAEDERFGSGPFRTAALRRWLHESPPPQWSRYLDIRSWWRCVALLSMVIAAIACLAALKPYDSGLALVRLLAPWSSRHWPTKDRLEFVDLPSVLAMGAEVQLEVVDSAPPLPDEVTVLLRDALAGATPVELPATIVGEMAVVTLPTLTQAVEVRAIGGDDKTMEWQRIAVIKPPAVAESEFSVEPPGYAQRQAFQLAGRHIEVLENSRVQLRGRFSSTIQALQAIQVSEPSLAAAGTEMPPWTARLQTDGSFVVGDPTGQPIPLTSSVAWRLAVTTSDGLQITLPEPWTIDIKQDTAPKVSWRGPALERLTMHATIAAQGAAIDDLGLASVAIKLQDERGSLLVDRTLWQAVGGSATPVRQLFEDEISLAELPQLSEGMRLSCWIEASDTAGQIGSSQRFEFTLAQDSVVAEGIVQGQEMLGKQLQQAIESQRKALHDTSVVAAQIAQTSAMSRRSADRLASSKQQQAVTSRQLGEEPGGVARLLVDSMTLFQQNGLEETQASRKAGLLLAEVRRVLREELTRASEAAASAHRSASQVIDQARIRPSVTDSVAHSHDQQTAALQALQSLVDRVETSQLEQRFAQELRAIADRQKQTTRQTNDLELVSLDSQANSENGEMQTELIAKQLGLAQSVDQLVDRVADAARPELEELTSDVRRRLTEAQQALIQNQVEQTMRRAAASVRQQQYAQAQQQQQRVARAIDEALAQLTGSSARMEQSLGGRAEALLDASAQIASLAAEQDLLSERLDATTALGADTLEAQQKDISRRTQAVFNELPDTQQVSVAAQRLGEATRLQQQTEQAIAAGQMPTARESSRTAAGELREAAAQLQDSASAARNAVRRQRVEDFHGQLSQLLQEQVKLAGQLPRLARASADQSSGEQENREIARQFTDQQKSLLTGAQTISAQMGPELPAFLWAMQQIEDDMLSAVAAIRRLRIEPEAIDSVGSLIRQLETLVEVLESENAESEEASRPPAGTDRSQNGAPRKIPLLASLKLVRGLQYRINEQTKILETVDNRTSQRRTAELAQQQQQLTNLVAQLLEELQVQASAESESISVPQNASQ